MKREAKKRALYTLNETKKALGYLDKLPGFEEGVDIINKRKGKIITCGVGKSSFVAMKMAATLTSLDQEAIFIHPTDALHGGAGVVKDGDILVLISASGESAELVSLARYLKDNFKIKIVSIVGDERSRLAELSDGVVLALIDEEGCPLALAPMASTTASLVVADMLAAAITEPHSASKQQFAKYHPSGSLGLKLKNVEDYMERGRQVPLVRETRSLAEALRTMTDKKKGVVAVINKGGAIVGVITDGDVRRFFLKHSSLEGYKAKDAMTKKPKTTSSQLSLFDVLKTMTKHSITSLFVLDGKKRPVGLIHIHDILGQSLS